jgi:hypothetical protein
VLAGAGVDLAAVERAHAGRPRIDGRGAGTASARLPRVNVAVSREVEASLAARSAERGVSRSVLVREALDLYLS